MILTPLQKLPNNVGNLGKIIVATGFEWLPKVQKSPNLVTLLFFFFFCCCTVVAETEKLMSPKWRRLAVAFEAVKFSQDLGLTL